jgi:hypothetical protein
LLKSFCDQLGCETGVAEKVARRLAFLHGSGSTEPEPSNDNSSSYDSKELPKTLQNEKESLSLVSGAGIPSILLTLAGGIAVNTDYRVVHNPQPAINRDLNNSRLISMNEENGIIDSFLKENSSNQVGFAFLPFVMEEPPLGSTAHVDLPCPPNGISNVRLAGIAKARPITQDDVKHLQNVLKVTLTYSGEMTIEQRLHLVFQGITTKFKGFNSRVELQKLLQLLLLSVKTVNDGSIDAAALHCWDDIREVIYLTKLAWVALKLPCLGAIAGKARMYAATHALLGIKATLGLGPPYEPANLELPDQIPSPLTLTSTSVEFYAIKGGKTLEDSLDALCSESMVKQENVTKSIPYGAPELLIMMIRHAAIRPIIKPDQPDHRGWTRTPFFAAIKDQVDNLTKQLETVKIKLTDTLSVKAIQNIGVDKMYLLGPRSTLCFSKSKQPIKSTRNAILFYPLIGLLKIETKSDKIPSPHLALTNLIFNNGQRMNSTSLLPTIPIVPTVVPSSSDKDNHNFRSQLDWMRTYMCDLMYPLVTFITQWLCDLKVEPPSHLPSPFGKDLVCQWVWAFVWELLDHYEGPYIDIRWLAKFDKVSELLHWKDNVRNEHCLVSLNNTRPAEFKVKEFKSNLYGLVVYLIYHMELADDFTLVPSFSPETMGFGIGTADHEFTLDESIYNATCPRFKHKGHEKVLSLFQMTQCLLAETEHAKDMAKKVDDRLLLWGPAPSEVLSALFAAAAADPNSKQQSNAEATSRNVDVTAAKLRLVLSWWLPVEQDPDSAKYTTPLQLENLLAKHITTALAPLTSQRKGLRAADHLSDKLGQFTKALQFVETKEFSEDEKTDDDKDSESPSGKPTKKQKRDGKNSTPSKKGSSDEDSDANPPSNKGSSDEESEGKPTKKRKRDGKNSTPSKKGSSDEESDANPPSKKGSSSEANPEPEGDENMPEPPRAKPKPPSGKPPTPPQPPSDGGAPDEDDASTRCEKRWKRLGVDKWPPRSKVIPDPKLTKEVLLMPCLHISAPAETGAGTVQFRKLTLGKIQCYICDFVPQEHLKEMLLFHHSEAFRNCYREKATQIDPYNVRQTEEEEEACNRFAKMSQDEREKHCKGSYYPYYSKFTADKSYWYEDGSVNVTEKMQVVDAFMEAIAMGVKEARKKELKKDIDFKETHAVALTTTQVASHQRAHLDHANAYDEGNDDPELRAYIGHMPLQSEGMVLRLENLTEVMLNCLDRGATTFDPKSEVVEDHLYLHIPFGSILLIDDRTFHGGHYGTAAKHRFHFVLSPYDWSPWKDRKHETTEIPEPMRNSEKESDSLLFLMQAARLYSKDEWERGDDDPNVAIPQLDTQKHLDLSEISKKEEYLEKRGPFCEQIAKKLLKNGLHEVWIRSIIDN